MSFHIVPPPLSNRGGKLPLLPPSIRSSAVSKAKAFFSELINSQPMHNDQPSQKKHRSRLIYVRDYPTLAESASTWYPPLLNAVRQYRQGLSRSGSIATEDILPFRYNRNRVPKVDTNIVNDWAWTHGDIRMLQI